MVTQIVAEYLPNRVTFRHGMVEMATSNGEGDAFNRKKKTFFDLEHGIKVILNVAQQLLYHVSYPPANF